MDFRLEKETTPITQIAWHTVNEVHALEKLFYGLAGLDEIEVVKRQRRYGLNKLPERKPVGIPIIFLRQFKNPLIYVLLVASVVSVIIKEFTDAIFIMAVLLINALIGTIEEWRAERNAASLQKLLKIIVKVKRGGREQLVPAEELVPGDLVFLESGNRVPADIRLLTSNQLSVDESLLTGESTGIEKDTKELPMDTPVADRQNMLYAGSTIMSGRGQGLVVATGLYTEVGNIAETVAISTALKPPLVIRMERFARQVSVIVLGAAFILAITALIQGIPYQEVFFLVVALAVSAIPEGLPVAITVALSIATNRMARRNVIVRELTAVEGLGSCTFIASDKTGTLTVNKQTVKSLTLPGNRNFIVTGEGYNGLGKILNQENEIATSLELKHIETFAKAVVICNEGNLNYEDDVWVSNGDAVDVALLALAYKAGLNPEEIKSSINILKEIPFESERKYTATYYEENEKIMVAIKGALEVILELCNHQLSDHYPDKIDPDAIENQPRYLSENGYRVLAVATGEVSKAQLEQPLKEAENLIFLGLAGLIDPLRPEAIVAIKRCQEAGVQIGIITGDHPITALTIAKRLGIAQAEEDIITGSELESYGTSDHQEFVEKVRGIKVFARVTPLQKLYITEALSKSGHFIAVTGDGVNDVPALKKANIGISMGSGTDLAKETASLIITDDNFKSIESGVEEGRFAYDNIRKVTYLLISTGAAEIVLFIMSMLFGFPLPLVAVQLLWLNLATNGIQDVALAFEGGEPQTMHKPPRDPGESVFNVLMIRQTVVSGLTMGLIAFGAWVWLLDNGYSEFHSRTLVLMLMVFLENVHVFNCRSETLSAFKVPLKRNWFIVGGVVLAQGIHILATHLPFMQHVLRTDVVNFREWLVLFVISLTVLLVMEVFKLFNKSE